MENRVFMKGFDWKYNDNNEKQEIHTPLFIIGKFDEEGNHVGNVISGRPGTIRVCESLHECKNVIRAVKRYNTHTLKPIRLLTGNVENEY